MEFTAQPTISKYLAERNEQIKFNFSVSAFLSFQMNFCFLIFCEKKHWNQLWSKILYFWIEFIENAVWANAREDKWKTKSRILLMLISNLKSILLRVTILNKEPMQIGSCMSWTCCWASQWWAWPKKLNRFH